MGKGFIKFRVTRVIPTFHSCRSKDPSTLPTNPVRSFLHHSSSTSTSTTTNTAAATTTTHKQLKLATTTSSSRSSIKRHVSSAISSARRGCLRSHPSPETSHTESSKQKLPPHFKWAQNPQWHVIAKIPQDYHNYDSTPPRRKIYNSAASDTDHDNDVVFLPPPPTKIRTKKTRRRRRNFQKVRISTSSDSGIFSEDDDNKERETLVSTDSPSPSSHHQVNRKSKEKEKKKRRSFDSPAPARLSAFMRKMAPCRAVADGKVRESFAVVKKSEDPLEDFKRSMVEMVVEKQMFEERELEELLRCFLSLNSERHHEAIVRAFTEIWEALFCQSN